MRYNKTSSGGFASPEPKEWKSSELSKSMIADYKPFSFVDGEGVRCALYVSGCMFNCLNCYNRAIQNFNYGHKYSSELEGTIIEDLSKNYCEGLSILGGEPMLNTSILIRLCRRVRKELPNKTIWLWTGFYFEELIKDTEDKKELLEFIDVIVDGRYDNSLRNTDLRFRGSNNQRILDVRKSLEEKKPVHYYDDYEEYMKSVVVKTKEL